MENDKEPTINFQFTFFSTNAFLSDVDDSVKKPLNTYRTTRKNDAVEMDLTVRYQHTSRKQMTL